jgi:hypothetical protein
MHVLDAVRKPKRLEEKFAVVDFGEFAYNFSLMRQLSRIRN